MNKIVDFFQHYMSFIVIIFTLTAYFFHGCFTSWIGNPGFLGGQINITHLLMVVMCGMGMTMHFNDFKILLYHPKDVVLGEIAQFLVMPLVGFGLCVIFDLPPELAVGVILVGCCPGGTSSNVMTYMAKGDLALSIGMTAVSTLLAPFLTPLLTTFYVGLYVTVSSDATLHVDAIAMFLDIVKIVIIPLVVGGLLNRFFNQFTQKIVALLPVVSCIAICLIVGFVIDANSAKLFEHGILIILIVILHNLSGYGLGFMIARIFKLNYQKKSAISIEIGMQNSGMATSLASTCFSTLTMATVPGALFSVWHNISGAIIANFFATRSVANKSH